MEVMFLQGLCQIVKDKKCFKEMLGLSEDIMKDINRQCLNLKKHLKELNTTLPKSNKSHTNLETRNNILYKLSQLWDLYHSVLATGTKNICSYLLNFCWTLCTEGFVLMVLATSMMSGHHFIVFQAHKVLQEIVRAFPEIIMETTFQELVSRCLTVENSHWTVMYIIQIFIEIIGNLAGKPEPNHAKNCCNSGEENLLTKNANIEVISDIICHHWLSLSNQCVDGFFQTSVDHKGTSQKTKPEFPVSQQTLKLYLSLGSMLMQFCQTDYKTPQPSYSSGEIYSQANSEIFQPKCFNVSSKPSEDDIFENLNENQFSSLSQSSTETQENKVIRRSNKNLSAKCSLELMASIQKIIKKLLGMDECELTLQLRRTIIQFLNDVVDLGYQDLCVVKLEHKKQASIGPVCIFMLKNISKLLDSVPKVSVCVHFGGQDSRRVSSDESQLDKLVYDRVITRKVLLLVVKSIVIMLQEETAILKSQCSELLEHSLEVWLKFIAEEISELNETACNDEPTQNVAAFLIILFAEQDDELMTVLLCLFNLYQLVNKSFIDVLTESTNHLFNFLNPHQLFLEFLHSVHYDHSLLLDFLISNETCFLQYFLCYLRHVANDWYGFLETVKRFNNVCEESCQKQGEGKVTVIQVPNGQFIDILGKTTSPLGKTTLLGNPGVGFQNCGQNLDESMFIESEVEMDLNSDHHSNQLNDVMKVKENALLSIKNNYGELSCSGSEDSDDDDNDDDNDDDDNGKNHYHDQIEDNDYDSTLHHHNIDHENDKSDYNDQYRDHDKCDACHEENKDYHLKDHNNEYDNHEKDCGNGDKRRGLTTSDNQNTDCKTFATEKYLDKSLSSLIRLRFSIERIMSKQLFPYPVEALLKVIKYIEFLYEGSELEMKTN